MMQSQSTAWSRWLCNGAAAALVVAAAAAGTSAEEPELPRIDPLEPAAALEAFDVASGYRVELVAAEPLVEDPVAFCFDARGRLVVVEMRGYSERPDAHAGRVRRLTDTDGDGRMDEVETLADGLSWPTAVACWGDGYLVAAAPDILFVGDPEAGQPRDPERWFTGFRRANVQGLVNSLRWGPDNRIHGATSSSGAELRREAGDGSLRLGGRDFAIDPHRRQIDAVPGGGQHGLAFNRWGDKFVCSNSDHLQQVMLVPPRSGRLSHTPTLRRSIAEDGPQADVYRASPVEPWRELRTRLRVAGTVPGPVEGGGRAAGYFTGATGVLPYEGDQWFDEPVDQALVCDVGSNLVHRKQLARDGLWWTGSRIDPRSELLRSSDIWFRPVQLGGGPDGALYIADMYREVIEHPKSLPPQIKSQLDLNSGNDRGRIWRLVATDRPLRRGLEPLDERPAAELVALLDHRNAWHRRTAARLLYERRDEAAIPALRELALEGTTAAGRVQALQSLSGLAGGLDAATLQDAWEDPHPRVRSWAVRLAGERARRADPSESESAGPGDAGIPPERLKSAAADPSIDVRFALALDARALVPDETERADLLWRVARRDPADPWVRAAVEGALGAAAERFLDSLLASPEAVPAEHRGAWLEAAVCQLLHRDEAGVQSLVRRLRERESTNRHALLSAVASQLGGLAASGRGAPLAEWLREELEPDAERVAEPERHGRLAVDAELALMKWAFPAEETADLLARLLHPSQPISRQQQALENLVGGEPAAIAFVVDQLNELTPTVRETAWRTLAGQRAGLDAIAAAVAGEQLAAASVPADVQRLLRDHDDPEVRKRFAEDRPPGQAALDADVFRRYVEAVETPGDAAKGRAGFVRACATCHRAGEEGRAVGPDLRSTAEKTDEQLLTAILDPNREVDLRFQMVVLETVDGRVIAGVLDSESDASVTLLDAQGERVTTPRSDIERLSASGRSLMPEGLHEEVSPAAMRDILAFLRAVDRDAE